jgi:Protein of unknown function (DUF3383)
MTLNYNHPSAECFHAGAIANLKDPASAFSLTGASAPRAGPARGYSGAGARFAATALALLSCVAVGGESRASSATTRFLFLDVFPPVSINSMFSFDNAPDVCNEFGNTSTECGLATDFFAGYQGSGADFVVARSPLGGERPRDEGAALNVGLSAFTGASCNPTCSMSIVLDGYTITTNSINWAPATSLSEVASIATSALESALPVQANFTGYVVPRSASLTGVVNAGFTTISAGNPVIGGIMALTFADKPTGLMLMNQVSGTPGGAGVYTSWIFPQESGFYSGAITENYGVLTITAMTSGTVTQGDAVYDTTGELGVTPPPTQYPYHQPQGIMSYIGGGSPPLTPNDKGLYSCSNSACVGTKWVVPYAQTVPYLPTVPTEAMFSAPNSVGITYSQITGPSGTWGMMVVEPDAWDTYIHPVQTFGGWPTGSAAQLMGLTEGSSGTMANGQVKPALLPGLKSEVLQDQCEWFKSFVSAAPVQYVQYLVNLDMGYSPPTYTDAFTACTSAMGVVFLNSTITTKPFAGYGLPSD